MNSPCLSRASSDLSHVALSAGSSVSGTSGDVRAAARRGPGGAHAGERAHRGEGRVFPDI
eukprot:3353904-Prymnesium_polylepis.1